MKIHYGTLKAVIKANIFLIKSITLESGHKEKVVGPVQVYIGYSVGKIILCAVDPRLNYFISICQTRNFKYKTLGFILIKFKINKFTKRVF